MTQSIMSILGVVRWFAPESIRFSRLRALDFLSKRNEGL